MRGPRSTDCGKPLIPDPSPHGRREYATTAQGRDRRVGGVAAKASRWGIAAIEAETQTETLTGSALKRRRERCERER